MLMPAWANFPATVLASLSFGDDRADSAFRAPDPIPFDHVRPSRLSSSGSRQPD